MKKERKVIETNGFSDELTLLRAFAILMKDKQGQVIYTFDTLMIAPKSNLKGFKISSVNIQGKYLKTLFSFIGKALNGSLGGKLDVRVDKSNE